MPTYRAYLLNSNDHIVSAKPIDADDDDSAIESARIHAQNLEPSWADRVAGVEVWLGSLVQPEATEGK